MNSKAKDKPGYWLIKLANMRRAKSLKMPDLRRRELCEEESWRLGFKRKNT